MRKEGEEIEKIFHTTQHPIHTVFLFYVKRISVCTSISAEPFDNNSSSFGNLYICRFQNAENQTLAPTHMLSRQYFAHDICRFSACNAYLSCSPSLSHRSERLDNLSLEYTLLYFTEYGSLLDRYFMCILYLFAVGARATRQGAALRYDSRLESYHAKKNYRHHHERDQGGGGKGASQRQTKRRKDLPNQISYFVGTRRIFQRFPPSELLG